MEPNAEDREESLTTPAPGAGARRAGRLATDGGEGRRRLILGSLVTAAVVLAALTVFFAVLWSRASDEQGEVDDVREVAGQFAQRFLTLDSENLEPTKKGVLELSTGAFRRTYEEGLETGFLQAMLEVGQTRTETTVEEIYVGEGDSRAAHVIVQTETVSHTTDLEGNAQPARVLTFWLELDLVKQKEGWRVDGVRNLNFGRAPTGETTPASGAPSADTQTTTTTAGG
ncbi:MAG: hypothetical protein HYU28_11910 [Actinobacteria bacterium]|nr:hypothetical protein [Actinomycetota bacterium]